MGEVGCLKDGHFQNLQVESGDITLKSISVEPWALFGMSSQFLAQNFGALGNLAGHTTAAITCPTTQLVPMSRYIAASNYIKYLQATDGSITAAQAELLLTNITSTGAVTITDEVATASAVSSGWMGTNAKDRNVVRFTNTAGTVLATTPSAAALNDNTTAVGKQTLILFDNFQIAASAVLTLNHNAAAAYKAAGNTIYVSSAAGSSGHHGLTIGGTEVAQPNDADVDTIITASGAITTILHGSFLYFNCADEGGDGNGLHVHGVLLTSGGTVACTFA